MNKRPILNKELKSDTFKEYYFLKEELIEFCKKNDLQTTGGKEELTNRIIKYLDTGIKEKKEINIKRKQIIDEINLDIIIEENFICSEKHRAFYIN